MGPFQHRESPETRMPRDLLSIFPASRRCSRGGWRARRVALQQRPGSTRREVSRARTTGLCSPERYVLTVKSKLFRTTSLSGSGGGRGEICLSVWKKEEGAACTIRCSGASGSDRGRTGVPLNPRPRMCCPLRCLSKQQRTPANANITCVARVARVRAHKHPWACSGVAGSALARNGAAHAARRTGGRPADHACPCCAVHVWPS